MKVVPSIVAGLMFLTLLLPSLGSAKGGTTDVKQTYVTIAHAVFEDSLLTAKMLQKNVDQFLSSPTKEGYQTLKESWLAARIPYGQSEVFRFGNPNVDDWEGKVNAWPLDEGLIDYVNTSRYEHEEGNAFAQANIISGKDPIDIHLLASYHEKGGSEANVATGYHAVEFLLWGQDLNAEVQDRGLRSYTDYLDGDSCTNGHCDRRGKYLKAAVDLLVMDLEAMVKDWLPDEDNYRASFMALDDKEAFRRMLFGMGNLSAAELAGDRINVALMAHSQEEEQSCFSDNTHQDIAENIRGILNVYKGSYQRVDGTEVTGESLSALVAAKDSEFNAELLNKLSTTMEAANAIVEAAEKGEHFDQQIQTQNKTGAARIKSVIRALRSQTGDIEAAAKLLGINNLAS